MHGEEQSTESAQDRATEVVRKKVEADAPDRFRTGRALTQPLAIECAAKNPTVQSATPMSTETSESETVTGSPAPMMKIDTSRTRPRPKRSPHRPARTEDAVPPRYSKKTSATREGGREKGADSNR